VAASKDSHAFLMPKAWKSLPCPILATSVGRKAEILEQRMGSSGLAKIEGQMARKRLQKQGKER
jgi:hypothetical protein